MPGIHRLLQSIRSTAKNPNGIEIILRIDSDDLKTIAFTKRYDKHPLKIKIKDRSKFISDLWEDAYKLTSADRIMVCADDVIFRTDNWDEIIAKASPKPDKNVYFMYGNDLLQGKGLATLPILSRSWVKLAGYFMPRGYKVDWCDTHLHDIARRLAKIEGIDPKAHIKYFSEIIFEHMHPNLGKAPWDKTYAFRRKMGTEQAQYDKRANERAKIAIKMAKYILELSPAK